MSKFSLLVTFVCMLAITTNALANEKQQMVRIAKIKVDSTRLDAYYAALREQMHAAIAKEPGVLSYQAVANKNDPASITIVEVYADTTAYQLHTQTPHFKKYKTTVQNMVVSLELIDATMIANAKKPGW